MSDTNKNMTNIAEPMQAVAEEPLPLGWHHSETEDGHRYYWSDSGERQWEHPSAVGVPNSEETEMNYLELLSGDEQLLAVMNKTALFIQGNGKEMLGLLQTKESQNPKFSFLQAENGLHGLFLSLLEDTSGQVADRVSTQLQQRRENEEKEEEQVRHNDADVEDGSDEGEEADKIAAVSPIIAIPPAADRDRIIQTAALTKRYGVIFQDLVRSKEATNEDFNFLNAKSPFHGYYLSKVESASEDESPLPLCLLQETSTETQLNRVTGVEEDKLRPKNKLGKWVCEFCDSRFFTFEEAEIHEDLCSFATSDTKEKRKRSREDEQEDATDRKKKHKAKKAKSREKKWECEYCSAAFSSFKEAEEHEKGHEREPGLDAIDAALDEALMQQDSQLEPGTAVLKAAPCDATDVPGAAEDPDDNDVVADTKAALREKLRLRYAAAAMASDHDG